MRIRSDEGSVEFSRGSMDNPWDFDVSVESQGFSACVYGVFPTSAGEFFQQVRAIERNNFGRAVLHGTEEFQFALDLPRGNGAFWVEVRLSAGFGAGAPSRTLACRFRVEGEYWSTVVLGLRSVLVGYPPPEA